MNDDQAASGWASQSAVTDPGAAAGAIDAFPASLAVLRGWTYLAHNAVHDLAALNKAEMLLWDAWGMQLGHGPGQVPEADLAVLDEVCALTADPAVTQDVLAELAGRDGLRVPATVTSFDPGGGPPRRVDVARVTA